jgi:hypothetical protein
VLALLLLGAWFFQGGLDRSPVRAQALASADFILWRLAGNEVLVRDEINRLSLGSFAVINGLNELGAGKALVTVDSPLATASDAEAAKLTQFLAGGGALIVLGDGSVLRRVLRLPVMDPTLALESVSQQMRVDTRTGQVEVVSASAPLPDLQRWFQVYGASWSVAGGINQILHSANPASVTKAVDESLTWGVGSHALQPRSGPTLKGLSSPAPRPTDSMGSDWINYQYLELFIHDGGKFDERTLITWRKLNDIYADRDWYLIEVQEDTQITDYHCGSDYCGYWIANRFDNQALAQYNDAFHRGFLFLYDPYPDPSFDSQQVSYTIGAELNSAAVGGSASVTRTYNKPAVKFYTERDFTYQWVHWREEFRGPDYGWYPFITPPADYSHLAYYTWHSDITRTEGGLSYSPNGMHAQDDTRFEVIKDQNFRSCYTWFLCWDRYQWVYTQSQDISADIRWSSSWLVSPGYGSTIYTTTPTLSWGDSGVSSWYLEIWSSAWSSSAWTTAAQWTTPALTPGYTYYWRVYSQYSAGKWSVASATWNFYVYLGGGGGGCVASGTPILTPEGYVPVEKLRPGDTVIGFDPKTGSLSSLTLLWANSTFGSYLVKINDGTLIVTALDQPIFIRNSTFTGWLRNPGALKIGDSMYNPVSNSWIPVTSLESIRSRTKVFDVVTSGPNTFIANGILLDMK